MASNDVLRVTGLTKIFPGVIANSDISFELGEEEIISIIGENGAGKSTFCKMLTGVYKPDGGEIFVNGEKVDFHSPKDSMNAGIAMVYQEREPYIKNAVYIVNRQDGIVWYVPRLGAGDFSCQASI